MILSIRIKSFFAIFLMVNSHPIARSHNELSPHRFFCHGELSPHRSFSHGELSPHRSFSHGELSPHRSF